MQYKATESFGYGVVRELVGHGLGRKMHESPEFLITEKRTRKKFVNGMVIAIEPMTNQGTKDIKQLKMDGLSKQQMESQVHILNTMLP